MSLGAYLKELRKKYKVDKSPTIDDVAKAVNISSAGLQKIEAGDIKRPDVLTLISLAQYYGVTLDSLIKKIEK